MQSEKQVFFYINILNKTLQQIYSKFIATYNFFFYFAHQFKEQDNYGINYFFIIIF